MIICAHYRRVVWSVTNPSNALTIVAFAEDTSPGVLGGIVVRADHCPMVWSVTNPSNSLTEGAFTVDARTRVIVGSDNASMIWRTAYATDSLALCALAEHPLSGIVSLIVVDADYTPMKGRVTNPAYAFEQ